MFAILIDFLLNCIYSITWAEIRPLFVVFCYISPILLIWLCHGSINRAIRMIWSFIFYLYYKFIHFYVVLPFSCLVLFYFLDVLQSLADPPLRTRSIPDLLKLESKTPFAVQKCGSGWIRLPESAASKFGKLFLQSLCTLRS